MEYVMRGEWFSFHEIMDELITLEVAPCQQKSSMEKVYV
jgi:hypothetical protein